MNNKNILPVVLIIMGLIFISMGVVLSLQSTNSITNENEISNNKVEISHQDPNIQYDQNSSETIHNVVSENEPLEETVEEKEDVAEEIDAKENNKNNVSKKETTTINSKKENQDKNTDSKNTATNSTEKIEKENPKENIIQNALIQQVEATYNNKILRGTDIISALQQYMSSPTITFVFISTDKNTVLASVGQKAISSGTMSFKGNVFEISKKDWQAEGGTKHLTSLTDFNNKNSDMYINYSKYYKTCLLRLSETQELVGVVFFENN